MKNLLVVLFAILTGLSACKQQASTQNVKLEPDSAAAITAAESITMDTGVFVPDITRTDSFVFASRSYALLNHCADKKHRNCCVYKNNPDRVHSDSAVLNWEYAYSKEEADSAAKRRLNHWRQLMKEYNFKQDPITCYLADKLVTGYAMSNDSEKMGMPYIILVSGEVDGQAVLVQLEMEKKPKDNSELPQFIRQILRLKS
ncbi:MAG TPA: hypothetical protein VLC98_15660 [Phnomibacter sp.]|nr:hypothetical protein [Phnomibacter sp.]